MIIFCTQTDTLDLANELAKCHFSLFEATPIQKHVKNMKMTVSLVTYVIFYTIFYRY